jgi:hypothetical protein
MKQEGKPKRFSRDLINFFRIPDGADASRRVIVLRIPIRFLSGASRLAIKRLQRTASPRASSRVRQPLIRSTIPSKTTQSDSQISSPDPRYLFLVTTLR